MEQFPEDAARAFAKWFAPFVADELAARQGQSPRQEYDDATCAAYVTELGVGVLNRAMSFFLKLDADGQIGSLDLAQAIGTSTPRNIPSNLTNSLKQRAKKMGLNVPWADRTGDDGRTAWADRDGIAGRMLVALRDENQRRFGP